MTTHAILTALGVDRPGIVDEVSQFIFQAGGNIEDSRMVNLRGQFALIVLIGGTENVLATLEAAMPGFAARANLKAELRPALSSAGDAAIAPASAPPALPFRLIGTGIDQPGLVHRISHLLREMRVNIESLNTRLTPAPYTGAPMFELEALLTIPHTTSLSKLRQELAAVCDQLNVDWELKPA